MAIAMQYGNGRNGLLNVGMSMTLLWTNVDDESAFAAQTLSLNIGGYDAVLIKFKLAANVSTYANTIGFVGERTTLYSSNASTTSYTYKRYATITTSDITFSTGYRGATAGTSYAIPCEVYGIKRGGSSGGSSSSGSGGGGGGTGTLTQITFDGTVYTDDGTGNVTFDETDPVFVASDAYSITSTDITNWNNKSTFSGSYNDLTDTPSLSTVATSGDYADLSNTPTKLSDFTDDLGSSPIHTHSQYLTSYTETDPVFSASAAAGITSSDISDWNAKVDSLSDLGITATATELNYTDGVTSNIQDQLDAMARAVSFTATGTIASFVDGEGGKAFVDLVANIEPVQSGSGDPSPDNIRPISGWTGCNVTRTGKNLLNLDREVGTPIPSNGANTTSPRVMDTSHHYVGLRPDNFYYPSSVAEYSVTNNSVFIRGKNNAYGVGFPVPVKANTTYTFSGVASANPYCGIGYYDAQWNYLSANNGQAQTLTFTTPADCAYSVIIIRSTDTTNGTTWTNLQLELGSTATAYEPYQSNTVTVDWTSEAGTVYGGTIDVATGLLTVTNGYIASYNGEALPSTWISDRDVYSSGTTPTTGAQVVYALATPQTYQLTPRDVYTLLGTNNVWADTGDIAVRYIDVASDYFVDKSAYKSGQLLQDKNLAYVENGTRASRAYSVNNYFINANGVLCRITASVSSGGTLIQGTNYIVVTGGLANDLYSLLS